MPVCTTPHYSDKLPEIDPDRVDRILAEGWTLPAAFYTDTAVGELENRLIFRQSWQLACTRFELREPGDYVTTDIASVPIVVVRDDTGIRAFANVCRHRGSLVMTGEGRCRQMRCGYHGWAYGLDGALKAAPNFAEGELPPFDTLGLRPVPVDVFGGFVFVCLEPQESLLDQLGDLPEFLAETGYDFPFADPEIDLAPLHDPAELSTTIHANWKIVAENTSECYHCPTMHRNTLSAVCDIRGFRFQVGSRGKFGVVARLPLREDLRSKYAGFGDKPGSHDVVTLCTLWPNTQIISGYVGEYVTRFDPAGPGKVTYRSRGYARPGLPPAETAELTDLIIVRTAAEDTEAMEKTQRGMESGYFESGPSMRGAPSSNEAIIRSFQRQVWQSLRPAFPSP